MKPSMKWFLIAIAAMGAIRFALTVAGVPDSTVKYFSMTVMMLAGAIYFAVTTATHKERLKSAFLLVLPYMAVETLALGYTWASGRQTIFHSEDYSMGYPLAEHTIGHIIGGVTWEPLFVFVVMEIIWAIRQKTGWALIVFLALLTSTAAVHRIVLVKTGSSNITTDSLEAKHPGAVELTDRRYRESAGWTYLHLFPGLAFMILGPLQFSRTIRAKYLGFHRWSGRIFLIVTLAAAIAGMVMAAQPSTYIGANAVAASYFFGGLAIACAIKAFYHIRRKEILLHREWMIRVFVIGLGVSTVRIIATPLFLFTSLSLTDVMGISFWTGWALSMIAGEAWIHATRT